MFWDVWKISAWNNNVSDMCFFFPSPSLKNLWMKLKHPSELTISTTHFEADYIIYVHYSYYYTSFQHHGLIKHTEQCTALFFCFSSCKGSIGWDILIGFYMSFVLYCCFQWIYEKSCKSIHWKYENFSNLSQGDKCFCWTGLLTIALGYAQTWAVFRPISLRVLSASQKHTQKLTFFCPPIFVPVDAV